MPKKNVLNNEQPEAQISKADKTIRDLIKLLVAWDDYRYKLINTPQQIGTTPPGPKPPKPPGL